MKENEEMKNFSKSGIPHFRRRRLLLRCCLSLSNVGFLRPTELKNSEEFFIYIIWEFLGIKIVNRVPYSHSF